MSFGSAQAVDLRMHPQCAPGSAVRLSARDRRFVAFPDISRFSLAASALPFQSVDGQSGREAKEDNRDGEHT
jgi:hypothetical protein